MSSNNLIIEITARHASCMFNHETRSVILITMELYIKIRPTSRESNRIQYLLFNCRRLGQVDYNLFEESTTFLSRVEAGSCMYPLTRRLNIIHRKRVRQTSSEQEVEICYSLVQNKHCYIFHYIIVYVIHYFIRTIFNYISLELFLKSF